MSGIPIPSPVTSPIIGSVVKFYDPATMININQAISVTIISITKANLHVDVQYRIVGSPHMYTRCSVPHGSVGRADGYYWF